MKEATGELNMTVVTLIAIAAIGAIFYFVVWPLIQRQVVNQTCRTTYGPDWHAVSAGVADNNNGNQAKVNVWYCCPKNVNSATVTSTDENGNSSNSENPSCHKAND